MSALCSSCSTAKYLQEDETFLKKYSINIEKGIDRKERANIKYVLDALPEQKPNGKTLFVPNRYFYYRNNMPGDTMWINRWAKKNLVEIPAIFSDSLTEKSARNIENYLKNKKGYYDASVSYETKKLGHFTFVDYNVNLDNRYLVKSMVFYGEDEEVIGLLSDNKEASLIKQGVPLDAVTFDLEKQRIISLLQNNGYRDFNANFIDIKGDSTLHTNEVEVFIEIYSPSNSKSHQQYTIGDVNVYTDILSVGPLDKSLFELEEFAGKNFFHQSINKPIVKPSILNRKIFVKHNTLYKKEDYYRTIQKLGDLSTYKFVRMEPVLSDSLGHVLDYNIFLYPHTHKWVADLSNDLFFSTANSVIGNQLLGLSLGGGLLNRNALGGSEVYKLSVQTGVEFILARPIMTNSLSLSVQNDLSLPRLLDIYGTFKTLNKIGIISDNRYESIKRNANTDLTVSTSIQNIFNFYSFRALSGGYGFNFDNNNRKVTIKQFALGLNFYDTRPDFDAIITGNISLQKSLADVLFTGLIFNEITYKVDKPKSGKGVTMSYLSTLEVSGLEVSIANKLLSKQPWKVTDSIDFANFVKATFQTVWDKDLKKGRSLVARGFGGIIVPYYNDVATPFVKQFYSGRPNSMRGWFPRELGPGGYITPIPANGVVQYYQKGDIKLELNLEYRTDLFYVFDGALFIDAGNIWTLNDSDRQNSEFSSNFYKQIAISAGYGLRFDFSYFIIRMDVGYKILSPYLPIGATNRWLNLRDQKLGVFSIAIGYPF